MKKLLVLLMVLAFVSVSSAAVFLSIDGTTAADSAIDILDGGTTVTLYVVCDSTPLDYRRYLDMATVAGGGHASMTVPVINHGTIGTGDAGDDAKVTSYGNANLYDYELTAADLESPYSSATGVHFSTVLTEAGAVDDTFTVDLLDGNSPYGVLDTITFTIVPEPMTVALLGLGGLFLRRRK